jgi:hypothetical protein
MTDERNRVMINRRNPRVIANACLACDLSLVACHSWAEHERQRCCDGCTHE